MCVVTEHTVHHNIKYKHIFIMYYMRVYGAVRTPCHFVHQFTSFIINIIIIIIVLAFSVSSISSVYVCV